MYLSWTSNLSVLGSHGSVRKALKTNLLFFENVPIAAMIMVMMMMMTMPMISKFMTMIITNEKEPGVL